MNEDTLKQLFAELIDAQEQANAVICGAAADAVGPAFAAALQRRAEAAQAAQRHPTRDGLLATALQAVQARR